MSDTKKETKTTPTEEVKEELVITLKESELNKKLQIAYDRGRVEMLAAIKSDVMKYFDDTMLSYVPR